MNMHKLFRTMGLVLLVTLCSATTLYGQPPLPGSSHYSLEKLADGVYAAIHNPEGGYAICNAGIIDLGDKTLVLDPFMSPAAARDLKRHAEALTGKPVSLVLNLHGHSDHTNGNQVFVPGADIISTPNARKYMMDHFQEEFEHYQKSAAQKLLQIQQQLEKAAGVEKTELTLWACQYKAITASLPELKLTLPNITITDTMMIHGSQRSVILMPTGMGHTDGDMVAFLPQENIFFMSDQLFVDCHPYLGDGDPESLKKNLERIAAARPAITVPGHGPVGDLHSVYRMIDYIETLTDLVQNEIHKGTAENQILEMPMPQKYQDWLISGFFTVNLKFLYHRIRSSGARQPE